MECLSTNCDGSTENGTRTHTASWPQHFKCCMSTNSIISAYKIFTRLALEIQSSVLSYGIGFITIYAYIINLYHQRFSSLLFTVIRRWFPTTKKSIDLLRPDKYSIALPEGFEPTTNRLTVCRSTTELWEHLLYQHVKELVVFVLYK